MAVSADSTRALCAHPLTDPSDWLARFQLAGGCWVITPDGIAIVGWPMVPGEPDGFAEARSMLRQVQHAGALRGEIREAMIAAAQAAGARHG